MPSIRALVVGVNTGHAGWSDEFDSSLDDAAAVATVLRDAAGADVLHLSNPTRVELQDGLRNFCNPSRPLLSSALPEARWSINLSTSLFLKLICIVLLADQALHALLSGCNRYLRS